LGSKLISVPPSSVFLKGRFGEFCYPAERMLLLVKKISA